VNRRGLLKGMLVAATAPAIVRAESLMVVRRPLIKPAYLQFDGVDDSLILRPVFANDGTFAWDPCVMSSLFQDAAGLIPVTGPGQPVGLMLDLSGNGSHFIQETSAHRPVYRRDRLGRGYLEMEVMP
jgi:hypothetical protein